MTDVHDEYIETVKRWELLKERNVLLTTHSTHLIYGYMALDIWKKITEERLLFSIISICFYKYPLLPHTTVFVVIPVMEN